MLKYRLLYFGAFAFEREHCRICFGYETYVVFFFSYSMYVLINYIFLRYVNRIITSENLILSWRLPYLAGVKDLYNKEIVGYCMSERMTKDIVIRALNAAILKNKPEPGLILHSDQGSQYCSNEYRKISNSYGMQLSMSRKGNFWDNAPM